ncbi:hypothetical protein [Streptomyces pacificus]|uniref:Uncharacterized protein n=1 Tax=Streptomyces pacificus TaxID=2705029 RepID=A0A6A0B3K1_9ACTN|nr:hypothetical protein [Streptomyces pacificus]GFH39273.1 hypothetical protein SCWH03_55380 [Streptomyces pacificus]
MATTPAHNSSVREALPPPTDGEMSHRAAADEVATDTLPFISHIAPIARDLRYDGTRDEMLMPVEVHFRGGTRLPTVMRVEPGRVELLSIQLAQAIDRRQRGLDAGAQGL